MIKRHYKFIISFALVVALLLSFCEVSFADSALDRAKAWFLTAITAAQITLDPVLYPLGDAVQQAVDPWNVITTVSEMNYQNYMDRSTIKIYPDYTVIDGVSYTDIWLSHDAADKFRTLVPDFVTAYSIASESNGTYASGLGTIFDIPVYSIGGYKRTQSLNLPVPSSVNTDQNPLSGRFGDLYWFSFYRPSVTNKYSFGISQYSSITNHYSTSNITVPSVYLRQPINSTSTAWNEVWPDSSSTYTLYGSLTNSPFDFDYVSGVIDADPLQSDEGLMIRVPSESPAGSSYSYDIHDLINIYPEEQLPEGKY